MRISEEKKEKICEQILNYLFSISQKSVFTINIAKEIARDEEFTKKLMVYLEKKGLVLGIKKNSKGTEYIKRSRWKLTDKTYSFYKRLVL